MAKVIPIKSLPKTQALSLTPSMIKTLKAAMKKQENNEAFGQSDLHGSFTVLVKRGYIDCRQYFVQGKDEICWFVTNEGINALKKLVIFTAILLIGKT